MRSFTSNFFHTNDDGGNDDEKMVTVNEWDDWPNVKIADHSTANKVAFTYKRQK